MSVRFITSCNRLASLSGHVRFRHHMPQALRRAKFDACTIVPLAFVSHRLMSTHSQEDHNLSEDDPVYPYLVRTSTFVPLTKLAMQLPDEVIEQLDGGLKKHLQRFPNRYRLSNDLRGVLQVRLTRPPQSNAVSCTRVVDPFKNIPKNRFIPLDSLKTHAHKLRKGVFPSLDEKGEVNRDTNEDFLMNRIFRSLDNPHSGVALWRLSEEYKTDENESVSITSEASDPQPRILHAFRWECIQDATQIQNALIEPTEDSTFARRLYICVRDDQNQTSKDSGDDNNNDADTETLLDCIEDYNIYRLCRVLSTKTFMPLHEVQRTAGDLVTQPLAAVLAIAAAESRLRGRTILEFCDDTEDHNASHSNCANPNDDTTVRVVSVRFQLDETRDLPAPYLTMTAAQITAELEEMQKEMPRQKLSSLPNHRRVRFIRRMRLLQRAFALHELGTTPLCNPDVLAFYVFDILPPNGELIMTGLVPQLLPEDVRSRTDARSRMWMESYPHLFRLVERAPEMYVQRMDAPAARDTMLSEMKREGREGGGGGGEGEVVSDNEGEVRQRQNEQQQEHELSSSSQERLLQDPTEKLRFVISLVAARLEVMRGRPLLPSHLPKFLNKELRQSIFKRNVAGTGCRVRAFLEQHSDVFVLTYGVHPHEPVITLKPDLDPKLVHCVAVTPAANNTSSKDKENDKHADT